jgi:uncharacterized membrane protein
MSEAKRFPWRTLLFVSAAINLVLIGGAIGAYSAGARFERPAVHRNDPPPTPAFSGQQRLFLAAMPPEVRARMREEMVQGAAQSRQLRQTAAQARRDAFEAAAQEPYDAARVKQAFARMRQADQDVVGVFHDRVADTFAAMTPAERRATLESLRNASPAQRREDRRQRWREWRERRQSGGG